jgi:hypothetical protein
MSISRYSQTPLFKKLGIKEGFVIQVYNAPKNYRDFFYEFPSGVQIVATSQKKESVDLIHIFATSEAALSAAFFEAKLALKKNGALWISWPKKSSKIPTEIDKPFVRNYGLQNGLVDVKLAAIDLIWSGHKFVYRVEDR